jgi:hypothetical protein
VRRPSESHCGRHLSAGTVESLSAARCMVALQRLGTNKTVTKTDDLFSTVVREQTGLVSRVETPGTSPPRTSAASGLVPCGGARRCPSAPFRACQAGRELGVPESWPALQIQPALPSLRCDHGESRIASTSTTGNLDGISMYTDSLHCNGEFFIRETAVEDHDGGYVSQVAILASTPVGCWKLPVIFERATAD